MKHPLSFRAEHRQVRSREICRAFTEFKLENEPQRQIPRVARNDKGVSFIVSLAIVALTSCTQVTKQDSLAAGLDAEQSANFPRAEKLLLESAKSAEEKKDSVTAQHAYYALARVYREAGQPEKAIPYYVQFLDIKKSEPPDSYHGMAWNLAELGDIYYEAGQWSLAIPTYKQALDKLYEYARTPETVHILGKLAVCYWNQDDETTAKLTFEQAKTNYELSKKMSSLASRRTFFDVSYALMLDDWARLSKSADISKESDAIWTELKSRAKVSPSATKQETIETIAKQYCHTGQPFEAVFLYDWLGSKDTPHIWALRNECLAQSKKFYNLSDDDARSNPYLNEFTKLTSPQDCFDNRQILCQKYAWSVPTREAIAEVMSHQPLVEIGAGTGYWASLIKKAGGDIAAFDVTPIPSKGNIWHRRADNEFADVQLGDETKVRQYPDRTLFLSWPPETNRCAFNTLELFEGNRLIYIGEGEGGCTGTKEFHDLLAQEWILIKRIDIPQWPGVYDQLYVYERKQPLIQAKSNGKRCETEVEKAIGQKLTAVAVKSPTTLGDICSLLQRGIKIRFVKGRNRAYFDQKSKTIYAAEGFSDSHKVLALSHEYAHAFLNPTKNPVPGKTGRKEFILQGFEQEADAVIHELIAAQELQSAGVTLDKSTTELLSAYQKDGRNVVLQYIDSSKNSATEEGYIEHFSQWYDESVPRSSARP